LQEHTRPILPKELREKLKIPNNFKILGKFVFQPLFSSRQQEVSSPSCKTKLIIERTAKDKRINRIPLPFLWATGLPADPRGAKKNKCT
jgi:hypothetical protein